jgi:predicted Fe-Mo cluster-binding NifX family protein
MQYEVLQNSLSILHGPTVGRVFAQLLLQEGTHTILVGSCCSDMPKILSGTGISILANITGSVQGTVKQFKDSCRTGLS